MHNKNISIFKGDVLWLKITKGTEQSPHTINCNWRCNWYRLILRCWSNDCINRPFNLINIHHYRIYVIYVYARFRRIIIQNTEFKSFADVTNTYIGPFAGFVTAWDILVLFIITGMAEVTAVAKYVSFAFEFQSCSSLLFCVLLLMSFNLLSARLFGELEFWFSIIKIATIIGLIVVGFVMILFAFKTQFGHASFTNLYEHGIFAKGASGFFMSFQMALFSFVGIEMIGVTAGETKDPVKTIPKAINSVPIRILIFYVGALAVIMSIIPWQQVDPDNSPFVKLFALIRICLLRA